MAPRRPNPDEQFAALVILDYLSDLFTASPIEQFSREQILVVLNSVKDDPELIESAVLLAYEEAVKDIP